SKPFLKPYTGKLLCKPASNNPYNNGNINAIQEVLITSPKVFNVLIMLIGRTFDDGNSLCINKTKEIVIMDRIADKINGNVSATYTGITSRGTSINTAEKLKAYTVMLLTNFTLGVILVNHVCVLKCNILPPIHIKSLKINQMDKVFKTGNKSKHIATIAIP